MTFWPTLLKTDNRWHSKIILIFKNCDLCASPNHYLFSSFENWIIFNVSFVYFEVKQKTYFLHIFSHNFCDQVTTTYQVNLSLNFSTRIKFSLDFWKEDSPTTLYLIMPIHPQLQLHDFVCLFSSSTGQLMRPGWRMYQICCLILNINTHHLYLNRLLISRLYTEFL